MTTSGSSYPTLSLDERDRRWGFVRELMDRQNLEALLVFGDRDGAGSALWGTDHWLTNHEIGSYLVFPRVGPPLVHVWSINPLVGHMESVRRGEGSWVDASQFRMGRTADGMLSSITELGLGGARFGVVGTERMAPFFPDGIVPWRTYQSIVDALPRATFTPVDAEYGRARLTRSGEELAMLRRSAATGERMCQAAIDATRVGATDADVLAALTAAAIRDGSWAHWSILSAGDEDLSWGGPMWLHRGGGPREIRDGWLLRFELFPFYGLYETQQQLTIAVGDVHPDVWRGAEVVERAYAAGLAALTTASTFADVEVPMTKVVTGAGGWNSTPNVHTLPHGAIGSMGPFEPQEWSEAYPALSGGHSRAATGGAELRIEPGMVFAVQPNIVLGRRRVNIGGTVIRTAHGTEELNTIANAVAHVDR